LIAGKYNETLFNRTDLHEIHEDQQNALVSNNIRVDYDNYYQFSSTSFIQMRAEPGILGIKLYDAKN
jgi:hypothetical protein